MDALQNETSSIRKSRISPSHSSVTILRTKPAKEDGSQDLLKATGYSYPFVHLNLQSQTRHLHLSHKKVTGRKPWSKRLMAQMWTPKAGYVPSTLLFCVRVTTTMEVMRVSHTMTPIGRSLLSKPLGFTTPPGEACLWLISKTTARRLDRTTIGQTSASEKVQPRLRRIKISTI